MIILKDKIFKFFTLLFCFSTCYSSSLVAKQPPQPPTFMISERAVLLNGTVIDIICPPCDTIIDTIDISYNINIDTMSGTEEERRKNALRYKLLKLKKEKLRKSYPLINTDSSVIRKRIKCKGCELVIKPLSVFSLPSEIENISVLMYGLTTDRRSFAKRLFDRKKYIGKQFTISGYVSEFHKNSSKAYIKISPLSQNTFMIRLKNSTHYDFSTEIDYKSAMKSNFSNINLKVELIKDLIRLDKEESIKRRVKLLKNLMYHKYYLENTKLFEKVIKHNIPDLDENMEKELIKIQKEISAKWK